MNADDLLQNPSLVPIAVIVALASAASIALYLYRRRQGELLPFWQPAIAPALPLSLPWIMLIMLLLLLNFWTTPALLPFTGLLCAFFGIASTGQAPAQFWKLHLRDIPHYFKIAIQALFLALLPLYAVSFLSHLIFNQFGNDHSLQPAVEQILTSSSSQQNIRLLLNATLIAPLWEEITFRGLLYPYFKSKLNRWLALILVSTLFASMHEHLPTFLPLFALTTILTLVYEKYGSLGYPIALHFLFNTSSALILLFLRK